MSASKAFPAPSKPEAPKGRYSFVARQPVFTTDEKVFGYELLFRDGAEDYFREKTPTPRPARPSTARCRWVCRRFATDGGPS